MNFQVGMSNELLDRLADAVVSARVVVPPITHIELDDVPALNGKPHADGKTVLVRAGKALADLKQSIRFIKSRDDVPVGIDRLFKTKITILTGGGAVVSTCDDASGSLQKNLRTGRFDQQTMPDAKTDHVFEQWLMVQLSGHWAISNVTAVVLPKARARQCQP